MVNKKIISVLFLFHYTDMNNGAVRSMVDVIESLICKYSVKTTVVYPSERGSAIEYLENLGAHCYYIPFGRLDYKLNSGFMTQTLGKAKQLIKYGITWANINKFGQVICQEQINLIYTNTVVVYAGTLLSKRYGLPHIWHIREFGKEDHGIGFLFGENSLYKKMNNFSDAVIYISNSIKQKYEKHLNIGQYVVYNDISSNFINPKAVYMDCNCQVLKATIIGSIQEGKGQMEAIKAVEIANQSNCHIVLHIAGETSGLYYEKLEDYVRSHQLEKYVIFDGFIRDTNAYRKHMDIGIVASSNEAFGRVTIEGMLSGMLMIGADSAGTKELIQDNTNGLLYELHNAKDLADKLKWAYKNRKEASRIAQIGYEDAVSKYTKGKAADVIYELIKQYGR